MSKKRTPETKPAETKIEPPTVRPLDAWEKTYHAPSGTHPGTCRGCTLDEERHGRATMTTAAEWAGEARRWRTKADACVGEVRIALAAKSPTVASFQARRATDAAARAASAVEKVLALAPPTSQEAEDAANESYRAADSATSATRAVAAYLQIVGVNRYQNGGEK